MNHIFLYWQISIVALLYWRTDWCFFTIHKFIVTCIIDSWLEIFSVEFIWTFSILIYMICVWMASLCFYLSFFLVCMFIPTETKDCPYIIMSMWNRLYIITHIAQSFWILFTMFSYTGYIYNPFIIFIDMIVITNINIFWSLAISSLCSINMIII